MGKASSAAISAFSDGLFDAECLRRGMGLGKANSGITTHVVVNKKDEAQGVSSAAEAACLPPHVRWHFADWLQ